jgi:hypothetical protein
MVMVLQKNEGCINVSALVSLPSEDAKQIQVGQTPGWTSKSCRITIIAL